MTTTTTHPGRADQRPHPPGDLRACGDCGRGMVPGRRRAERPAGVVVHAGFGLCETCYHRPRRVYVGSRVRPLWRRELDPVVVDRLVEGSLTQRPTSLEVWAAVERLDRLGWSARRIAVWLGCSGRTVTRARSRLRGAVAA